MLTWVVFIKVSIFYWYFLGWDLLKSFWNYCTEKLWVKGLLIHEWKDIGHCLVHYFGNRICGDPICCISMDFQPWFFELGADVDWWWFDHRLLNHVRVRFLYEYQDALNQYCSRVNFLPCFTMKTSLGAVFFGRAAKITWVSNSCYRLREPTPRCKK